MKTFRRRSRLIHLAMVVCAAVPAVAACGPSSSGIVSGPRSSEVVSECRDLNPQVAPHPDPASATRATTTLSAFAAVGWNAYAPAVRPSTLTGGLFVNFRPSWDGSNDPAANTNIRTLGDSDAESGSSPRHDPLTDLSILRNIDALQSMGVTSQSLNALRCKLQPVTAAEFVTYGVERGWVYDDLVDLSLLDPRGPWADQAKTFAVLLGKRFAAGIETTSNFRPDWVAESAAALTDAGKRFEQPSWTSTGHQLALDLCRTAANPHTGFFPAQAHSADDGPARVVDPMVKVGSQAQLLDALLGVYDDTQDQEIYQAVRKDLNSLQSPNIGVADSVKGGFFYSVDVDGTGVRRNYKETRQAWLVPLFRHAASLGLVSADVAAELATIVREQMYQPDSRGYVYRVRDDWSTYVTNQDGERVQENWVSSEATGIAVQALLGPLT